MRKRVLFASCPASGHVQPLLPLAAAFRDAGWSVAFGVGPEFVETIATDGYSVFPVDGTTGEWFAELERRTGAPPGEGLAPDEILPWFVPRLFGAIGAERMVDDFVDAIRSWQPQLVVYEQTAFAAPLASAVCGVPSVHHAFGPLYDRSIMEPTSDAVAPLWRQWGLEPPPLAGLYDHLCLTVCPPSLETPRVCPPDIAQPLRPVPMDTVGTAGLPDWIADLPDRPTVYATLGTVTNDPSMFSTIVEALAGEPINVVLTVGNDNDPAAVRPVAENVRVERYVAQSLLLPHCDAVVCHVGSGTMFGTLINGLPMVALPRGADQFVNADRCVAAGAAVRLWGDDLHPAALRDAVHSVLEDDRYRTAARRLAGEIAEMPSPAEVASTLAARIDP